MPDLVDVLGHVGGQLEKAERLEDVQQIVRVTTRRLLDAQGATFVLLENDSCYYADEDSVSPLWKGQRFPASTCIGGWAMEHRETVVIPDIRTDPRIPQEAYRPTFVRSMIVSPILGPGPLGALGAYWDHVRQPSDSEVRMLETLAGMAADALARFPEGLPDPGFHL